MTDVLQRSPDRPRPHPSVHTEIFAEGELAVTLLDERTGELHHLNPSAAAVWILLDGETAVSHVIDELGEIFEVPPEDVASDVRDAIGAFFEGGLLVDESAEAALDSRTDGTSTGPAVSSGLVEGPVPRNLVRPPDP